MKKIICMIFAFISVMVLSINIFAAGSVTASQKSEAYNGKNFTVDILLSDNPGLSRLDVKITFNNNQLNFNNAVHGSIFSTSGDQSSKGSIRLSYSSSGNTTKTGKLATLRFNAVAAAGTSCNITVEVTSAKDSSGKDVTVNGSTLPVLVITEPENETDSSANDDDVTFDDGDDNIFIDEFDENTPATEATEATESTTEKTTQKTTEKTKKTTEKTTKKTTEKTTTTSEPTTTPESTTTPEPTTAPEPVTTPEPDTVPEESSEEITQSIAEAEVISSSDTENSVQSDSVEENSKAAQDAIPYEIPDDYVPTSGNKEGSGKKLVVFGIVCLMAAAVVGGVIVYMKVNI